MITIENFKVIKPEDAISKINGDFVNVIFWDTCGILDIMNLVSDSSNSTFIEVLLKLNDKIMHKDLISCTSNIIIKEITDNYEKPPLYQAKKFIDDTVRNFNKIQSYIEKLGLQDSYDEVVVNSDALMRILESQIQLLLDNTLFIENDDYLKLARDRVIEKIPPSQKNEFKDSVIWETCIGVAKNISNEIDLYFISSNEKDYGKNGNRLPEIKSDMEKWNIIFKHKITDFYNLVNSTGK